MDRASEQRFMEWATGKAPSLHRFAYLLCGDWHEAEDLVQEALAKTALRWNRVERVEHPDAYVRTVLVNACRSMWRRPWARALLVSDSVEEPGQADATHDIGVRDELLQALRALPLRQRAAVVLRYYEQLSEAETATALGCSVGTVKSQSHKAMQALRRTLAQEELQC